MVALHWAEFKTTIMTCAVRPTWQYVKVRFCPKLLQLHGVVGQQQEGLLVLTVLDSAQIRQYKTEELPIPVYKRCLGAWQDAGGLPITVITKEYGKV